MTFLPPGERIDGTTAECAHLHLLLACFRACPPPMRLPEVTGCPLPELLSTGIIDKDIFNAGYAIMAARYKQLGVRTLLPRERVWTGNRSSAPLGSLRAWGGFHHPAQGYRHIQMDAAVTVYGDLTDRTRACPRSAALDLVRSYAHDCLHYATFRRYQLTGRGEIARVQYGINLRQSDGRAYSAPDEPGGDPTRNLGILMEGATDVEATAIARQTAESCGITSMSPEPGMPGLALADATGTLAAGGIQAALASGHPYAQSLGRFGCTVTTRYKALLAELDGDSVEAHGRFIAAMISGDLAPLEAWLDARRSPGSFARLFRAPFFDAEPALVR